MFYHLLNWNIVQKVLLNTLLVSIPEELFLVMFTLILVGEFEYWKEPECKKLINKFDYIRIFVPTVIIAFILNITKYIGLKSNYISLVIFILLYIIMIITNDIFGDASAIKWMLKAFVCLTVGFLIIGISEFIYMPFLLYSTGLSIKDINQSIFLNFLLSLPSRFIQYSLLFHLIIKRRTLLKGNIFKHIFTSSVISIITILLIVFNLLFLWVMNEIIAFQKLLFTFPYAMRLILIIIVMIFPLLNILAYLWCSYFLKNRETEQKKISSDKLYKLLENLKLYTNNENYDNIRWKLNQIGMDIQEIAESLYQEEERKKNKY